MTAIVFDGKEFAKSEESKLLKKVSVLKKKGITPKLASILTTENEASQMYLNMKKKAAEKLGMEVEIFNITGLHAVAKILRLIKVLNMDTDVHGIMIQMPLSPKLNEHAKEFVNSIDLQKDVDGMRDDSPYLPATVSAVLKIAKVAGVKKSAKFAVIGSEGMVGKPLTVQLKNDGYEVIAVDKGTKIALHSAKEADVLVSTTGKPGLIKSDFVKNGAVVIDVGSPKGDVLFNEVARVASFITPVPGGVGPVTIISLLENVVISASSI